MASFDFAALAKPISPDEPCGPDLDLEGDPDFTNYVARSDGIFPPSFFTRDDEGNLVPFDRAGIEFPAEFKTLDRLLGSTHDLRLLTIYGRLLALNRDIGGFSACIDATATLLRDQWDDVHPRGEDGDFTLRMVSLQGFDDTPSVIMPLQHAPLVESRRSGAITYRSIVIASGEAAPRQDEAVIDRATIERAFADAELDDLKALGDRLRKIADAAALILATSLEKAGRENAVDLEKLSALVGKIRAVVDPAIAARDPTSEQALAGAAEASSEAESAASAGPATSASTVARGRIKTHADAEEALSALARYFRRNEPSNPAALLIRQAQTLVGKSFVDVVRLLLPRKADEAKIQIGADRLFGLTFEQLPSADDMAEAAAGYAQPEEQVAASDEEAPASGAGADGDGAPSGILPAPSAAAKPIEAATRADAIALLDQIVAFYRVAEPSSAIPLLADRARSMIDRDFLTLLKDVLPNLGPARE